MKALKKDMQNAADNLEFEKAAKIRDEIRKLEQSDMGLTVNSFTKNYKSKDSARSTQGRAGTKSGKRYQKK
jgi:excinuclease ABC subunit B